MTSHVSNYVFEKSMKSILFLHKFFVNWFFSSQIELAKKYAWRHPFDGKSMLRHCKKCVRNIFETKDLSPEYFSRRPWKTFRKYHGQDQDETLCFLPYETPWRLILIYGKNPSLFASKSWNFYFLFVLFILKLEKHARFTTNAYASFYLNQSESRNDRTRSVSTN